MGKSITQLTDQIAELAAKKGWGTKLEEINVLEKFALIHSEVSEALEGFRNHNIDGKDGVKEEFADIFIRLLHLARILDIDKDLEDEINKKIAANYNRDWRHKNETHVNVNLRIDSHS